jgi:hypothetical protein
VPPLSAKNSGAGSILGPPDEEDEDGEKPKKIPIVCEILDPKTQQTILGNPEMRAVSDFLQSNDMVSKILAMVCEDRTVKLILDEMLAPDGASMACVPASKYCTPGEEISYFEVACRAQEEYGEILLGYIEPDETESTGYKAPLINSKEKTVKMCWDGHVCCLLTGRVGTFHSRYYCASKHIQLMTAGMVHVTNLTPPGEWSVNPSRAYGRR